MKIESDVQLVISMNYAVNETDKAYTATLIRMIARYRGNPNAGYLHFIMLRYQARKVPGFPAKGLKIFSEHIADFERYWRFDEKI